MSALTGFKPNKLLSGGEIGGTRQYLGGQEPITPSFPNPASGGSLALSPAASP